MDSIKGFLRRVFILVFYLSPFFYLTGGTMTHEYINENISWVPALRVFTIIGLALTFFVFSRFGRLLYFHSSDSTREWVSNPSRHLSLLVGLLGSFRQSMGWFSIFSAPAWLNSLLFPLFLFY